MSELTTYNTTLTKLANPVADYYVFTIKRPQDYTWQAGQYARIGLPGKEFDGKQLRALSMCNLADSDDILFATRTHGHVSPFKQALLELKPGEAISVTEPIGKFTLPADDKPLVLVAGGIGVTPLVALLAQLNETNDTREITLLYSAKDTYLFSDELLATIAKLPNATATFVGSKEQLHAELSRADKDSNFMLSSSPAIVKSLTAFLEERGVDKDNISSDVLFGYEFDFEK